MNKAELITAIAKESGLSKKDSKLALEAFVKVTSQELKKGKKVQLVGYGSFNVIDREAREGVNPADGSKMFIPASRNVTFKIGKDLKKYINM